MNGIWILSNAFFACIVKSYDFSSLSLLWILSITFHWFSNVELTLYTCNKSHFSKCRFMFIHCWIWLANIFIGDFYVFICESLQFSLSVMSFSGFGNTDLIECIRKYSLCYFSGRDFRELVSFLLQIFGKIQQWKHLVLVFSVLEAYNYWSNSFNIDLFRLLISSYGSLVDSIFQLIGQFHLLSNLWAWSCP